MFVALLAMSGLAVGAILDLTRYRNFFYDEWEFIVGRRAWDFNSFILPHGNHWSTIPIFLWKILFVTVGIRSHVPYEMALLLTHVLAVCLLFALVRRRSGDLPAFAAALTLLFLGSGADDIVWAFQVAWAGSVALGLLAMLLLEGDPPFPGRIPWVSLALLGSLMCSTVGVAFVAAVACELFFDPKRRQFLLTLVAPLVVFVAWLLLFDTGRIPGNAGISDQFLKGSSRSEYFVNVGQFVLTGLQAAAAGVFGVYGLGWALLPVLSAVVAWHLYPVRRVQPWQIALVFGCIFWFFLVSLGRVQISVAQASQTRYVYVGVVFLLPLAADVIAKLPWRGLWRPALTAVFALLLLGNITQLVDASLSLGNFMRYENADLQTIDTFRDAPDLVTNRYLDNGLLPQVITKDYLAATRELGSPGPSSSVPTLQNLPSDSRFFVDRVMTNVFGDALTIGPGNPRSGLNLSCQVVDSTSGATLDFQTPDDQPVMLQASQSGNAYLFLGFLNPASGVPLKQVTLAAATPEWIHLPETGQPVIWKLRVETVGVGMLRVCSSSAPRVGKASYFYGRADSFTLGTGWTVVHDIAATSSSCAKVAVGTRAPKGAFGDAFVASQGAYDLWYRIRVASNLGGRPEMLLGLVDIDEGKYVGSGVLPTLAANTTYGWVQAASSLTPVAAHRLRFQANIVSTLSTDWFIDEAALVPVGTPMTESA